MIRLRDATIEDLAIVKHWDEQEHVIASDPDDDWDWEAELLRTPSWRQQLIAELNRRPIGFVQIIDPALEETHYWGHISEGYRAIDIWIGSKDDVGKGYGTEIIQLSLAKCFSNPIVKNVLIDPLASNVRAIRFYERIGFEYIEDRRFGNSECKVYAISRESWEAKHH